jgi:hypothetical protein
MGTKSKSFALVLVALFLTSLVVIQSANAQSSQSLSISPNQGPIGTLVDVKGVGFNSFMVNFSFAGKYVTWAFQASITSGANAEFLVPNLPPGGYTVSATDGRGGYAATTFTITVRVPKDYDTAWQQEYGDRDIESVSNVIQTSDGGFAFLDLGWGHGLNRLVPSTLYKVNASGEVQWKKTIEWFAAETLIQTSDSGYTLFGQWSTYGTTYQHTPTVIKTDSEGNIRHVQNFSSYTGLGFVPTSDDGFATLDRRGGNLQYYPGTSWTSIIKTNSNGIMQWNKTFNEFGNFSIVNSMIQTRNGGYALVGSCSFNGTNDTPNLYFLLIRTDSKGNFEWSRQFGNGPEIVDKNQTQNAGALQEVNRRTFGDNEGMSVTETVDGGFLVAGIVYPVRNYSWWGFSYGPIPNMAKTLLVKTDSQGNMLWNQTIDGYETSPIIQTSDDGFVFAGSQGIVKIDANGTLQWTKDDVTFPSLGIRPYLLGVSNLIETSDGALAGIGVGTTSEPYQGNIYLFETKPFLPLPTPSPTSSIPEFPSWTIPLLLTIMVASAGLLVYHKKHKRTLVKEV